MKPLDASYRNLSCQLITEALFRLMEKEDYRAITISAIAEEADIARRTFYLNFKSKEDILDQHYAMLIKEYDKHITPEMTASIEKQALYFFQFWQKHRAYATLLAKNNMLYMLVSRFHLYLDHSSAKYFHTIQEAEKEYVYSYIAGGLWMLLQTWQQRDFKESPRQLADLFSRTITFTRFPMK